MANKNDRRRNFFKGDIFTKFYFGTIDNAAWRSLSPTAQALFPILKLEFRGPQANNNGNLSLSYRQAAEKMGVKSLDTIGRAFHDLQAKGFIVLTSVAALGVKGHGTASTFELTDTELPGAKRPRRLFLDWREGHDFPVQKAATHNPKGHSIKSKTRPNNLDSPFPKIRTNSKIAAN